MKTHLILPISLAAALAVSALAQQAELAPKMKARDKNGDGKLSADEFWSAELFPKIDTDKDGFATGQEIRDYYVKNPAPPPAASGLPASVEKRAVTIWSDGTKMAGDLYLPRDRKPDTKLPAVVFCSGTGGTKKGSPRQLGPIFAQAGYAFFAFDYRGWGESESQIFVTGPASQPDEKGEITVKGKPVRWQMNLADQTFDIRCAIAFLAGEQGVDPERIGVMGSSYGGGLATWIAANEPRVKCAAAQVPGMGGMRSDAARKSAFELQTKQARGETEPIPFETGKLGGKMAAYANMRVNPAKNIGFNVIEAAEKIRVPMIIIDAEKEELMDIRENGQKVADVLKAKGVPVEYHVIPGISHYGVYREAFDQVTKLEIAWFDKHLKGAAPAKVASAEPAKSAAEKTVPAAAPEAARPARPPEEVFAYLDSDVDGKLSVAEFEALSQAVPYFREHPEAVPAIFKRLDADNDGGLSLDEYRKFGKQQTSTPKPEAKPEPAKPSAVINTPPKPEEIAFFEKNIRPVLVDKCYNCHSADAEKIKGGLVLDTRDGTRTGGDTGPAVVPGDLTKSLMIEAIRYTNKDTQMPPEKKGGKLPDTVIANFEKWVKMGAPDPREGGAKVAKSSINIEKGREHWAFQPVKKIAPPAVKDAGWPRSDIDRFLLAGMEAKGVKPVADADPRALIRRVTFDLTGLPPTPPEVEAFVSDSIRNPQSAIRNLTDRLLASPQFGERWGRHWLDVARYADSTGRGANILYPQAWRYRDYVIASFNADKPYDQFLREQIAGDLLPAKDDAQRTERIVATGFLALGPKQLNERDRLQFQLDVVDEQLDTLGQAMLGLTVGCARCHDHKFDPIPQRDYYALAGIFRSSETCYGTVPVITNAHPTALIELPAGAPRVEQPGATPERLREEQARLEKELRELTGSVSLRQDIFPDDPEKLRRTIAVRSRLVIVNSQIKNLGADGKPRPFAMGVREKSNPADIPLYQRGEPSKPADPVPRGFLQVVSAKGAPIKAGSGRRELADWIVSPENPLTARVMVNRIWHHLFGRGLVPSVDNFGTMGEQPGNPALLDHLAARFVEQGWSVKKLIREIVLTRAYQLGTNYESFDYNTDPDNALVWRMTPRRLDAEAARDAMLAVSGKLVLQPPLGSTPARIGDSFVGLAAGRAPAEAASGMRSVYLTVIRDQLNDALGLFDFADPNAVIGNRDETTTPAQSLFLMNSPVMQSLAETWSKRLLAESSDGPARVRTAYLQAFGRAPTESESRATKEFFERFLADAGGDDAKRRQLSMTALNAFCQALFASAEFRTLN